MALLPQGGHAGLGIPKADALLRNLPPPHPTGSVLNLSKPGVMADFMPYLNLNQSCLP